MYIEFPVLIILSTSCRQSMDLYSNVPSPSLHFLGTPSLSRLGSSFFGSSLIRRHTPEVLPSLHKPLILPAEEEKAPYRRSSHGLIPPLHPRKSSIKKIPDIERPSKDAHGLPISHQSTYGQAVVNGKFPEYSFMSYWMFPFIDEHYATRRSTYHCNAINSSQAAI